jgi:predicted nucleotidyltransferase
MTKELIMKRLHEIRDLIESYGHKVLLIFLQGSQNYGLEIYTEEYTSDIDVKVFIMPNFKDLYYNRQYSKTLDTPYGLADIKDIRMFPELIKKANPTYIELMFAVHSITTGPILFEDIREKIVDEKKPVLYRASYSMAVQKMKALKHPYPTVIDKIERYGYDPKQLHHIVRLYFLLEALDLGMTYNEALHPTGDKHKFLMDIKLGKYNEEEADKIAEEYMTKLNAIDQAIIMENISGDYSNELEQRVFKIVEETIIKQIKEKKA